MSFQAVPNTGTDENGVVQTIGNNPGLVRFTEGGRILSEPRFAMADFAQRNYPLVKISFAAVEVDQNPQPENIQGPARFLSSLDQAQEVPAVVVQTGATGRASYFLNNAGDQLRFAQIYRQLRNVTMSHLHMAPRGEAGPVVVDLIEVAGAD